MVGLELVPEVWLFDVDVVGFTLLFEIRGLKVGVDVKVFFRRCS